MLRFQIVDHRHHGRRDGAGHDGELRGNHGHRQGSLGTDAVAPADLGNHRQHRVGHVPGTGQHGEGVGDCRRDEGDVAGVAVQDPGGQPHQIVQATRRLHGGCGRNHRHDHQHHVDGGTGGLQVKAEGQNGQTYPAEDAQTDTADLGTHQNTQKNNRKLNGEKHDNSRRLSGLCVTAPDGAPSGPGDPAWGQGLPPRVEDALRAPCRSRQSLLNAGESPTGMNDS